MKFVLRTNFRSGCENLALISFLTQAFEGLGENCAVGGVVCISISIM